MPFKMVGGDRIDDTPVHKALCEVLTNCLVNTDFYVPRGVVIKKDANKLVLENPGYIRVGKPQMFKGGDASRTMLTLLFIKAKSQSAKIPKTNGETLEKRMRDGGKRYGHWKVRK